MTHRNTPLHWQVQWQHISPMMEALYRTNSVSGMLAWAERQWALLARVGMTCAASELNRTESQVRGVSLAHLHLEFVHRYRSRAFEPNYAVCLQPFLRAPDVAALARERYWGDDAPEDADECLDCAVGCLIQAQIDEIFPVLRQRYASPLQMGLDMMNTQAPMRRKPMTPNDVYGHDEAISYLCFLDVRSATLQHFLEDGSNAHD